MFLLEIFISILSFYSKVDNYKLTLLSRIIINTIIAPHGITDVFNKTKLQLIIYGFISLLCFTLDELLELKYKLPILTFLSIHHMSYDIGLLWSYILHFFCIVILPTNYGLNLFLTYMCFIHVPLHYYRTLKNQNELLYVIIFSFICFLLSFNKELFLSLATNLPINGIIWAHIIFNIYIW